MSSSSVQDLRGHSDFTQTQQSQQIGRCVGLIILMTGAVLLRVISQLRDKHFRFRTEEYLILIALFLADGLIAGDLVAIHFGTVLAHNADLSNPDAILSIYKITYVQSIIYGPCLVAIKLSILLFYRRVFYVNQHWFKIAWWTNVIYVVAWGIASTIVLIFQCLPISFFWNRIYLMSHAEPPFPLTGECLPQHALSVAPANTGIVSDFAILLLPSFTLRKLQMGFRKKVGLILLACVCSIVRVVYIFQATESEEVIYDNAKFLIYTSVEECMAIICACLPFIASLMKSCYGSRTRTSQKHSAEHNAASVTRLNTYPMKTGPPSYGESGSLHKLRDGSQDVESVEL